MDALIPFTTSGSLVDIVDSESYWSIFDCLQREQVNSTDLVAWRLLHCNREGLDRSERWTQIDRSATELRPIWYVDDRLTCFAC